MRTWAKQEFFIIPMGSLKRSKGETARLQINNGSRLHSYFENWKPHNHNERFYFKSFIPFSVSNFKRSKYSLQYEYGRKRERAISKLPLVLM